ncbi:MAG: C-type lectin domain-containing protein [Pseudomonadota bacterium]
MTSFTGRTLPRLTAWLLVFGLTLAVGQIAATSAQKPLFDTPVYHAPSKSYFALIDMEGYHRNWAHAAARAAKRSYRGTRGHLAVIDSPELHEFLRITFRPNRPTWIGLRYFCGYGKSQWVTGKVMKKGDYKIWNRPWNRSGNTSGTCSGSGYLPIYYTAVNRGFRWAAQGPAKNWHYYFIQYPTGEE